MLVFLLIFSDFELFWDREQLIYFDTLVTLLTFYCEKPYINKLSSHINYPHINDAHELVNLTITLKFTAHSSHTIHRIIL